MAGKASAQPPPDAVEIRTLLLADRPLLAISVTAAVTAQPSGRAADLVARLETAGIPRIERFLGHRLPQGAKVGFSLDPAELRLVDEREATLLRIERDALDEDWVAAATRLKGTMLVLLSGASLAEEHEPGLLATIIDEAAAGGRAVGAIVGVAEQRPTLPLMLG